MPLADSETLPVPAASAAISVPVPPTGTVTFLFSDIEGSTKLLQRLGDPHYATVLDDHQRLLRAAFAVHNGYEVDTQGDSFFVAFPTALDALAAAVEASRALARHTWPEGEPVRVRIGLHSGTAQLVGTHYVGLDVHRAARIAAAGHGGQILLSSATAELARQDLSDGITLRDVGAHRLKDLHQAEHVYQAILPELPADFPPLKALDARPHNLPVQPSSILGREREVAAICMLLRRDDLRLVTLTGPGGIGKTRLSLQVAAEVLDAFPDGVWNVRLSRLSDPTLVVPTIATTLYIKDSGVAPLAEVLRTYLRDKHLLLVLDNFEQVVAAAAQIGELLAACPGVKFLVTSRVPLHVRGEHEYVLHPLALPDMARLPSPERLSQYAAVALFMERAQAAHTDFAVTPATAPAVAAICARLDGLPLAIELAAARVKLLPPPALVKRLERSLPLLVGGARDLDERQQTMRATLDWSYNLLAPEEQRLFRRLAVFAGGCTLEAVEAVGGAPEGAAPLKIDVLHGLGTLVDQSLIQQREEEGEPRFGMLHVIREFATEQLEASDEADALRWAHMSHYLALAEAADYHLIEAPAQETHWLDRLDRDHDNLRAVLAWAHEQANGDVGVRLAAALVPFWIRRGHVREGRVWVEGMLALRTDPGVARGSIRSGYPSSAGRAQTAPGEGIRARALVGAALLAFMQRDYAASEPLLEQGLARARAVGDLTVAALALDRLGLIASYRGELQLGAAYLEESLALHRQAGSWFGVTRALNNLGAEAYHQGDLDRAAAYYAEALTLGRERGDRARVALELANLGDVARHRGEMSHAEALVCEALALDWERRDSFRCAEDLESLAGVAAAAGQGVRGASLLGVAAALRETLGVPQTALERADIEQAVGPARAEMGEEAWQAAYAAGQALAPEQAIAEALGTAGE
jgi:predicted ATPase/class 3 adenylate cyclase